MTAPDPGDLVWLEFSPRSGHEQSGRRPTLALSPRRYNGKVGLGLFCPVTTHAKGYPFEVPLPPGLGIQGVVLADQVKSLDWRSRRARKAGRVPPAILEEVLAKVGALLSS